MKDKDGIIVNGYFPCLSVYADLEEIRNAIGGSVEKSFLTRSNSVVNVSSFA